jgi:hypothetical protein
MERNFVTKRGGAVIFVRRDRFQCEPYVSDRYRPRHLHLAEPIARE